MCVCIYFFLLYFQDINAKFTYNFISLPSCNGLEIDHVTGMISVQNSAELDREKQSKLSCQVHIFLLPGYPH